MKRVFLTNNEDVKFKFTQTPDTFKVIENSKFKLSKRGDYRLIKATKVSTSTMEMVEYLSSIFKIKEKEIGYAGLKDKHATTTQYITLPSYVNIKKFKNTPRLTIEEIGYVKERLKIGNLISNSFEITLQDLTKEEYKKLQSAFNRVSNLGFANFFGYQRFGTLKDSSTKGEKISKFGKGSKNQNSKILLASYQSVAFNEWLNKRLELSFNIINNNSLDSYLSSLISPNLIEELKNQPSLFKLLPGDLGYFYNKGKKDFKIVNNIKKYIDSFLDKKFYITGVLFGNSVRLSTSIAGKIERRYIDYSFNALRGARRDAWVFPKNPKIEYNSSFNSATLYFTLPPGSYATVLLEELQRKELI